MVEIDKETVPKEKSKDLHNIRPFVDVCVSSQNYFLAFLLPVFPRQYHYYIYLFVCNETPLKA
jgi:hypothetical protein